MYKINISKNSRSIAVIVNDVHSMLHYRA